VAEEEDWTMTTTTAVATTAATQGKQMTPDQRKRTTLRALFDQQKPELLRVLPKGMDPERLFRIALTECLKNPRLLECSQESWALAIQTCGAQGLYPDSGLGYMYLIPRSNSKKNQDGTWSKVMEITAQRGYQGDIALARKSGEVSDIYAEVVYEKDVYKVTKGLDRNIEHVPYDGDDEPGALKAVYAVAKLRSGDVAWVALTRREVMHRKASAMDADNTKSPWKQHEAAMWRKTAIHELFKWLPKSSEESERVARAILTEASPDQRAIETTAIDLGRAELPAASTASDRPATLDDLAGQQHAGPACSGAHEPIADALARSLPIDAVLCSGCGEEVPGRMTQADADRVAAAQEREVGADDGDVDAVEATRLAEVKRLAEAAQQQAKKGPKGARPPVEG
jgi:recombination protein RecT